MALEITYLGHAGFLLSDGTHTVAIDPFLTGNPLAPMTEDALTCNAVLLSHGHEDHIGDTVAIAKRCGATIIANYEIASWSTEQGLDSIGANPGGKVTTDWGWVALTQAFHSSSYGGRPMGVACGLVVHMGGKTIYHLGDTGLFSDLKLIGEIYKPDVACIPIGDLFTMGPELGTRAAEFVGAPVAIPMHYKTFPPLAQSAVGFAPSGIQVKELEPGATWSVA